MKHIGTRIRSLISCRFALEGNITNAIKKENILLSIKFLLPRVSRITPVRKKHSNKKNIYVRINLLVGTNAKKKLSWLPTKTDRDQQRRIATNKDGSRPTKTDRDQQRRIGVYRNYT